MKWAMILSIVLAAGMLAGCDSPLDYEDSASEQSLLLELEKERERPWSGLMATGEFSAIWQGCEDGEHEEPGDHEEGDCGGDHETHDGEVETDDSCSDDHVDDGHNDDEHTGGEGCSGNRPARDFYVQFNAQAKKMTRGDVTFAGLGTYEGIDFNGSVTWVEPGREPHELFFGGEVTGGTVDRGCFLFSIQDNGEGNNAEADRLQYRLYGSGMAPCHIPDHFPKGYPIAVYEGNLQVHQAK
ncbi:hypothetical protein [Fodinibius sediminis]|uniref:Lipoprotein n=1 Tax=Fodinibius sediminis TaxID=1214077 RepID=A0A521E3Y0_9BACT|nr:hypothetical protein [Fodinibius sediminis]SMO78648.1 hypothetical protein SAMN06265218_11337 [Fodinibius sediminis]